MRLLLICCFLLLLTVPASAENYTTEDDEGVLIFREGNKQPIDKSRDTLDELTQPEERLKTPRIKPTRIKSPHMGWYSIDYNNKCKASEGPAALIKAIQNLKKLGAINSKVTDVKVENGKPVIVRVSADDGVSAFGNVFFRSKELCKAAADEINRKNTAEINRYK